MTDNKPLPALYSSTDVRPLKMEDFRFAHEQVGSLGSALFIYFLGCEGNWWYKYQNPLEGLAGFLNLDNYRVLAFMSWNVSLVIFVTVRLHLLFANFFSSLYSCCSRMRMYTALLLFIPLNFSCTWGGISLEGFQRTRDHDWMTWCVFLFFKYSLVFFVPWPLSLTSSLGVCERLIRVNKHERAPPMERPVWRRRVEEEDVSELLHVEVIVSLYRVSCPFPFHFFDFQIPHCSKRVEDWGSTCGNPSWPLVRLPYPTLPYPTLHSLYCIIYSFSLPSFI